MREDGAPAGADGACAGCLVARRRFVRDAVAGLVAVWASIGIAPHEASALGVRLVRALASSDEEHSYPIPDADGVTIDKDNGLILARYQQKVYAFNLSCPHQNTALRWNPDEGQFQCPKHHSHYQPDGVFVSGRATRSMDRLGVRRDGANVVVDADHYFRQDKNPTEWAAAFLQL